MSNPIDSLFQRRDADRVTGSLRILSTDPVDNRKHPLQTCCGAV
jgi:hypothetical protein